MGSQDKINELEAELSKTKYNKATQHHVGLIKAKIARLKDKQLGAKGGKTEGYAVKKSGDASVILIGFPSVGKSTLLNSLTAAQSAVAAYEFTTLDVIPGILEWKGAMIQLLDVPGIIEGASIGRGRGRQVLSVAMNADMVLLVVDVMHPEQAAVLIKEVSEFNLRLNQHKPDVRITKTARGGMDIGATIRLTKISHETIRAVCKEFGIMNAQIVLREDITVDQLIDVLEGNKRYVPAVTAMNKVDLVIPAEADRSRRSINADVCISADKRTNLLELKNLIYSRLQFIRVYTKEAGNKADLNEPLIMLRGTTIRDVCNKLHKDFITKFKYARIWGSSRFPGQLFKNTNYILKDQDIIEIHTR